ncbi:TetR/AcrR family transcriptional regulator [Streptomyces sp. NPDC060223]|uniref:TetR/AcrR family transcriptional regulator n=1 Tax=unclassified Streptomyces TaxID=2593676 RepID=UPI0036257A5D
MSPPLRTPRSSSRLRRGREDVLAAATALFCERGYDATSMSDIADHLGMAKASVYHHVKSKSQLLHAATGPMRAALLSLLGAGAASGERSVHRLAGLLRGLVAVAEADPPGHALLWGTGSVTDEDDRDAVCRELVYWRLVELLEQAIDEDDVRDDIAPRLAARLLLGAVVGPNCPPEERSSLSPSAIDVLFEGLAPAGGAVTHRPEGVIRETRAA